MWSFVGSKQNQRWLWYAIERTSRNVIAFALGPRTDETYRQLLALLPPDLLDRYYTDDWGAYKRVPFQPLRVRGKRGTQRIERKNLTLRTRIKRLTRKTICFSKCEIMHDTVIALFINEFFF
jgi:insertion element IS1 protein InsB